MNSESISYGDPVAHMYDALGVKAAEKTHEKEAPERFYASNAGNCHRRLVHQYRGDRPLPFGVNGEVVTGAGDYLHDRVRELLLDSGVLLRDVEIVDGKMEETGAVRKEFTKDGRTVTVSVRPDGAIFAPVLAASGTSGQPSDQVPGPGWISLEVKTMDPFSYKWLNKAYWEGGDEQALEWVKRVKPGYYEQMITTMGMTGYDRCLLLPVDRGLGTIGFRNAEGDRAAGVVVDHDPVYFDQLVAKFFRVQKMVEEDTIPEPDHLDTHKECKWCDFRYLCHDYFDRQAAGLPPLYPGEEE